MKLQRRSSLTCFRRSGSACHVKSAHRRALLQRIPQVCDAVDPPVPYVKVKRLNSQPRRKAQNERPRSSLASHTHLHASPLHPPPSMTPWSSLSPRTRYSWPVSCSLSVPHCVVEHPVVLVLTLQLDRSGGCPAYSGTRFESGRRFLPLRPDWVSSR